MPLLCVVVGLRVVGVPGAAVSCRWSAVSVFSGRRCSSPMWWSVLVLVSTVTLLMVVVVVQLLVLVHAVVVEAIACVVVVAPDPHGTHPGAAPIARQ